MGSFFPYWGLVPCKKKLALSYLSMCTRIALAFLVFLCFVVSTKGDIDWAGTYVTVQKGSELIRYTYGRQAWPSERLYSEEASTGVIEVSRFAESLGLVVSTNRDRVWRQSLSRSLDRETSILIFNEACVTCTGITSIGTYGYTFTRDFIGDVHTLARLDNLTMTVLETKTLNSAVQIRGMCSANNSTIGFADTIFVATDYGIYYSKLDSVTAFEVIPQTQNRNISSFICGRSTLFFNEEGSTQVYWLSYQDITSLFANPTLAFDSLNQTYTSVYYDLRSRVVAYTNPSGLFVADDRFQEIIQIADTSDFGAVHVFNLTPPSYSNVGWLVPVIVVLIPIYALIIWLIFIFGRLCVKGIMKRSDRRAGNYRGSARTIEMGLSSSSTNAPTTFISTNTNTTTSLGVPPPPKEAHSKSDNSKTCQNCQSTQMAFIAPCGDVILCLSCANLLKTAGESCPKCHGQIESVWPI